MGYSPFTPLPAAVNRIFVTWTGRSGTPYKMELNPIGALYHRRPGVYIACRRDPSGALGAKYVGQTEDFDSRIGEGLRNHHRWPSIWASGATHFCTLHWPGGLAERCWIERDLIDQLNPPLNRV